MVALSRDRLPWQNVKRCHLLVCISGGKLKSTSDERHWDDHSRCRRLISWPACGRKRRKSTAFRHLVSCVHLSLSLLGRPNSRSQVRCSGYLSSFLQSSAGRRHGSLIVMAEEHRGVPTKAAHCIYLCQACWYLRGRGKSHEFMISVGVFGHWGMCKNSRGGDKLGSII